VETGEDLDEDAAEREHVIGGLRNLPPALRRRKEARRPELERRRRIADLVRELEIQDPERTAFVDQHVAWRQVAVHVTCRVQSAKRGGEVGEVEEKLAPASVRHLGPWLRRLSLEALPRNVVDHQIAVALDLEVQIGCGDGDLAGQPVM